MGPHSNRTCFWPPVAPVLQLRPVLVCRETNSTSLAIFYFFSPPSACKCQLPTTTRDRVGKTPWHSAKSGPGGFWTSPPLKSTTAPPAPLWFHWEGLCWPSLRLPSPLQTAHTLSGSPCPPILRAGPRSPPPKPAEPPLTLTTQTDFSSNR